MAVEDGVVDDVVNELVTQLTYVYAVADAYASDEPCVKSTEQILEDTRLLLGRHGVEV